MRRLLRLSTLALGLALPRVAGAQAAEAEDEVPAQEEAVGDEGGYEPDQRGAEEAPPTEGTGGGEQAAGEEDYEPDQRGAEDEAEELDAEPSPAPAEARSYAEDVALSGSAETAAGRGLGLDLQLPLGAGLSALDAFGGNNLVQSDQGGSAGGSFGAVIGLGLGPLTIGPRLTFTIEPGFVLGAVGLDVQVALTSGWVAPTMRLSVSYAFMVGLADPLPSQNHPDGVWTELGLGARFHVAGPFSIGVEVSAGWLALFRGEVPMCTDPCTGDELDLSESGAAHGVTGRLHVSGRLRF
jgi:hypothetical protein